MPKLLKVYTCGACGNTLGVLKEGTGRPVCCGQPMELSLDTLHVLAQTLGWTPSVGGNATTGKAIVWATVVMTLGLDLILRVSGPAALGVFGGALYRPAAVVIRVTILWFLCWFLYRGHLWARAVIAGLLGVCAVMAAGGVFDNLNHHSDVRAGFSFFLAGLNAVFMLLLFSSHVEAFLAVQLGQAEGPDASTGSEHHGSAQTPLKCPHCRLLNPPTAHLCDCGYDFHRGTERPSPEVSDGGTSQG